MPTVLTDIDQSLWGRSIEPPRRSADCRLLLDVVEPWGGGRISGRIESRKPRKKGNYVVSVTCSATWLDCAPPKNAQARSTGEVASNMLLHGIGIRIWLDEQLWAGSTELGELSAGSSLPFAFELPPELPRAFEGARVSFRWRIVALRQRAIGHAETSFPLLLREDRSIQTVRTETSPIGTWTFKGTRADAERDAAAGPCSVQYEDR